MFSDALYVPYDWIDDIFKNTVPIYRNSIQVCWRRGAKKKKLSMQGVRGQAILLCEFIRLDFFRDWVFEEGAYLFIKNKFRHTFYYRDDPTPSVLKHTYQYIKILHCNIINCYIAVLRTKSLYTSILNF